MQIFTCNDNGLRANNQASILVLFYFHNEDFWTNIKSNFFKSAFKTKTFCKKKKKENGRPGKGNFKKAKLETSETVLFIFWVLVDQYHFLHYFKLSLLHSILIWSHTYNLTWSDLDITKCFSKNLFLKKLNSIIIDSRLYPISLF